MFRSTYSGSFGSFARIAVHRYVVMWLFVIYLKYSRGQEYSNGYVYFDIESGRYVACASLSISLAALKAKLFLTNNVKYSRQYS